MTAITGSVKDVTGVEDNETPWSFASVIRFAEDGSVITEKPWWRTFRRVAKHGTWNPMCGVLSLRVRRITERFRRSSRGR